jgi:hypothetical protein
MLQTILVGYHQAAVARLPGDYAAGHALGVIYELNTIPDEARLSSLAWQMKTSCSNCTSENL